MISDVKKEQTFDSHWIAFQTDSQTAEQLFTQARDYLSKGKKISLKIKTERRSLDANAYFWVLLGELSKKLRIPSKDIYINMIVDGGAFEIFPVKIEHAENFIQVWESSGVGNICIDLGKSKLDGYQNIKCYYGSSTYDTEEMSRLIDAAIVECELQGIETLPDEKLNQIKNNWRK